MTTDDSRRVSLLLGVLFGLAGMGSASAAIVVPIISDEFGLGVGGATWTISLYALMFAVTTAVYGRVSDLVGIKAPLLFGIVLMSGGALVAALAPTFGLHLVGRLLQGAGAAAVPTLGVAVLTSRYDARLRSLALGRLAATAAAISCLGPLLGGAVEHSLGWRAVMAIPILGALVLPFLWPALSGEGTRAELDLIGAALVAATAAGLVLLVQSPSTGATVAVIGLLLLVCGLPAVAWWVRRRPHGFLPVAVIRNGTVVRHALAGSAVPAAWFAQLIAVPAVLIGDGWQTWTVGLLLVPSAVLAALVPRLTGGLIDRLGPSGSLSVSAAVAAGSLGVCAIGAATVSPVLLALGIVLNTFAFGIGQPSMTAAVGDAVAPEVRGIALGVATLVFMTGGSVGSAVVGGLGDVAGIGASLGVLAALPLLGVLALVPEVRRTAGVVG
ncbi:MFS transporter [Nocardioides ferulae]|uniref:MFS transporter n=1 Tax=Nocardioides ferulae TaxID=2340821 RepID=UPI0013DE694C|nr:MFS transporter [Nocardioides ferulae]